jgi:hypothetical protein
MRAKRENFIKNHRSPPATRNSLDRGIRECCYSRQLLGTLSQSSHSSPSTSVLASTHEGITRQACNITGASKKESTCVCSRPLSQMNVFLATHPALNQSSSIAHLGHAGTLPCTIPGWACTIRNGRENYLFRSYDQWHFFVCRQEPSKIRVCRCRHSSLSDM